MIKLSATEKRESFLNSYGHSNCDKWCVEFKDGSYQDYKHIQGGARELAEMIDWEEVGYDPIDGEIYIGAL